ncbi:MAG: MBL fold metallo-hydrolase [bacterium]|nr:MBL fold metallo-hydrolase [bacterium]
MKSHARGNFGEHISAMGMYLSPAYLVKGSRSSLMIDAGVSYSGPLYLQSIEKILGTSSALTYIFLTHSHWDHLGSAPFLKRKIPGVSIGASGGIAKLLEKESVIQQITFFNESLKDQVKDIPIDEDVTFKAFSPDLSLKEGDTFDLGGISCEVLEVPGHTRDSLAFFIPEIGALFPGESIGVPEGDDGEGVQVEFLSSYTDYLNSIEKISALKPKIICMAHQWVFTDDDAAKYLEKTYSETIEFRALIEKYLNEADGDSNLAIETMTQIEYDEKGTIYQPRFAYVANLTTQVKRILEMQQIV